MVFLDPEPKRVQHERKRHSSGTGFFSSQRPLDDPRDGKGHRYARRKPPEERANNQQSSEPAPDDAPKSTVRIVSDSPKKGPSDLDKPPVYENNRNATGRHGVADLPRLPESAGVKPAGDVRDSGFQGSVSECASATNETPNAEIDALHVEPTSSIHASVDAAWHRLSGSSSRFSTSSTLKEGDSSFIGGSSRSRLSQVTTLRDTPTPHEQEHRERIEAEDSARSGPAVLETLEEASPERSTVRAVPESLKSEPSPRSNSSTSQSSPNVRPVTSPSTDSGQNVRTPTAWSVNHASSTESLPTVAHLGEEYLRTQQSQGSFAQSPTSTSPASSPNVAIYRSGQSITPTSISPSSPDFVTHHSDGSRPRSRSFPLHGAVSNESIASRLQSYDSDSPPSTGLASSTETLPPLQIPKKRLRHKRGSLSLSAAPDAAVAQGSRMVTEEEIDTLPYPRYQYATHLSTIASESDRNSWRSSQPLSNFSLGSGVLTGDDASGTPLSRRQRGSAPMGSAGPSSPVPGRSSGEEAGDMTLGIFREESAKPQPLFKRPTSLPGREDRRYDGPLPPIPPIPPNESDENFDTVSELQTPVLKEQRSGKSLRSRSNSTPSQNQSRRSNTHSRHLSQISYVSSDRGSHASSLFPVWAKQFYQNNISLMSASKVSLGGPPARPGQSHLRNDSSWTERSITSRLGTGYKEIETPSLTSSHFLPSIFRPRTRDRSDAGGKKSKQLQKSKARPSQEASSRPDSMAIYADPLPREENDETTAAGQPKYGELKGDDGQRPNLPRKYSKQKQWNEMTFPRPMTKDRLSDFGMHIDEPHLGPTKRTSNRLSIWRAPSFVESLDTLVRSRTNRQILFFAIGFVFPFSWMLAALLPIPKRPISANDLENSLGGSEDDVAAAMMKHEAGDAEKRWKDEKMYLKARWWRSLNRLMSLVGLLVIGAVIALAVVATTS